MTSIEFEIPQPGQMVVVRQRPAVVRDVKKYSSNNNPGCHGVQVEYLDGWLYPEVDNLVWEREVNPQIVKGNLLPKIDAQGSLPDIPERLQSFLNAYRWSSVARLGSSEGDREKDINLVAPWQSAVQVEDYQLYPVLKSLLMPRVSLLLADDVGLGKTIEAGLIISELFARRRIKRVLVICPASLQNQWQEQLLIKFHLEFEIVDRDRTFKLQRSLGIDSNPWATFPRIITSMDYLRQRDIQEQFFSANRVITGGDETVLPWQMLVVDEAHNLAPTAFGESSDRYKMLRQISLNFEHRLFLTATPHNGYTSTFTGMLELLDPVRFKQTPAMDDNDRRQVELVMVRRLKSELNISGEKERFAKRTVTALDIPVKGAEKQLFDALRNYRKAGSELLGSIGKREKQLGDFLFMLLTKRLLSSPYAFACTWWQHVEGMSVQPPSVEELLHARKRAESPVSDDEEKEQREADVARKAGGWLKRYAGRLKSGMDQVSVLLEKMGLGPDTIGKGIDQMTRFSHDAKWERLRKWVDDYLISGGKFKKDERLIIFTEYKDTLTYLLQRFKQAGIDAPQLEYIYGGASPQRREQIKEAFNDPASPLRILVATDTLAEGIDMQYSCRYIIHQDIPWNPMRLDQRNGRVDRHSQYRDVYIFHFTSQDEADMQFMSRVVDKVERAREDLGSMGQILDQAIMYHFNIGKLSEEQLSEWINTGRKSGFDELDTQKSDRGSKNAYNLAMQRLLATEMELGLNAQSLALFLRNAMEMEKGELVEVNDGVYRIRKTPPAWRNLVKETLEIKSGPLQGSLPKLVFDPAHFEQELNGRRIFRYQQDTVLVRLGHPLMRRATGTLKRCLWEKNSLTRWTVAAAPLPARLEVVVLLHLILEITNELRETVHQEVLTVPYQARGDKILPLEQNLWQQVIHLPRRRLTTDELNQWQRKLKDLWLDHESDMNDYISQRRAELIEESVNNLRDRLEHELTTEKNNFDNRINEIRKSRYAREQDRLKKAIERQYQLLQQVSLFDFVESEERQKLRELEMQQDLINSNSELMLQLLEHEKKRVLESIIPKRFSLANLDLQPLAVEYVVRDGGRGKN